MYSNLVFMIGTLQYSSSYNRFTASSQYRQQLSVIKVRKSVFHCGCEGKLPKPDTSIAVEGYGHCAVVSRLSRPVYYDLERYWFVSAL